jgi:hypothetical protein
VVNPSVVIGTSLDVSVLPIPTGPAPQIHRQAGGIVAGQDVVVQSASTSTIHRRASLTSTGFVSRV